MVTYINRSISRLEIGGKEVLPDAEVDISADQAKDPGTDWLIRSQFLRKPDEEAPPTGGVTFIPTAEPMNGAPVVLTEPTDPETPPAQQGTKGKG